MPHLHVSNAIITSKTEVVEITGRVCYIDLPLKTKKESVLNCGR